MKIETRIYLEYEGQPATVAVEIDPDHESVETMVDTAEVVEAWNSDTREAFPYLEDDLHAGHEPLYTRFTQEIVKNLPHLEELNDEYAA